jgi:hypothetical protein
MIYLEKHRLEYRRLFESWLIHFKGPFYFLNIFLPLLATFIFIIFFYVVASIAYIYSVYGAGVRSHDHLIMSRLPQPLDHGSRHMVLFKFIAITIQYINPTWHTQE